MPRMEVTFRSSPELAEYKFGTIAVSSFVFHKRYAATCFDEMAVILNGTFCKNSSFFWALTSTASN